MAKKQPRDAIPDIYRTIAVFSYECRSEEAIFQCFCDELFREDTKHIIPFKGKETDVLGCRGTYFHRVPETVGPSYEAEVMLVTASMRHISVNGEEARTPLGNETFDLLKSVLKNLGMNPDNWYMTSLLKFVLPETIEKNIPAGWRHYGYPWLLQEIKKVKPKYILCMGMHVVKEILGAGAKMESYYGTIVPQEFQIGAETYKAKLVVLPSLSEKSEEQRQETLPRLREQLKLLAKDGFNLVEEANTVDHRILTTPEQVREAVTETIRNNDNIIAIDMEWEGEYPGSATVTVGEPGPARVLTFQFSPKPGKAFVCVLDQKFIVNNKLLLEELKPLFHKTENWEPRIGGHFLRADLPWLLDLYKYDAETQEAIKQAYAPAETFEKCREHGGWDTSLMFHAVKEDRKRYGLKDLAELTLGMDAWDLDLSAALDQFISKNKLRKKDLHGFGCVPPEILYKYAAWDADATRRLAELCLHGIDGKPALLDSDAYGNPNWEPYWRAHSASLALLEMEETGFILDIERLNALSKVFDEVYGMLLEHFSENIVYWPEFNPQSTRHKLGVLFGRHYTKTETENAPPTFAMPKDAEQLTDSKGEPLEPLYNTAKVAWDSAMNMGTPATDAMTLAILAQKSPDVQLLYDICKLGNTLKGNIRRPEYGETDDDITYSAGIYSYMREDGTVHTRLNQMLKTGRLSSTKPNLQNISKSAEETIQRVLGTKDAPSPYAEFIGGPYYLYPMRTILKAGEGRVFIESDFTGAELAVMAWVSGDKNMIEHVRRNALPEDDPDYYDIHSNIAVRAFRLTCPPTKKGLASIGKKHLRVAAKAIVFGVPYGRGAKAIQNQLKSQGVPLELKEVEDLLNAYFTNYPATKTFLSNCRKAVTNVGYVCSVFKRYRRFPNYRAMYEQYSRDNEESGDFHDYLNKVVREDVAKYGREACNAPIQSAVADAVNVALRNLMNYRKAHPELDFRLHMQIHDALLVSVPKAQAEIMLTVMQKCMVDDNPLIAFDPSTGAKVERRFSIESDLYYHWGEPVTLEQIKRDLETEEESAITIPTEEFLVS